MNIFNWKSETEYAWTDYNKYLSLLKRGGNHLYSKLPDRSQLNQVQTLLWSHKEWIIGGAAVAVTVLAVNRWWKNRPQYPTVKLESTLNVARVSVEVPKAKRSPPNVSLTFVVDISSSMKEENRLDQVKTGLNKVLDSAQRVADAVEGTKIEISIVKFDSKAETICKPTLITPANQGKSPLGVVRAAIGQLAPSGTTDIIAGLNEATANVEEMAKKNKAGSHTLVLLTDGDESLEQAKVSAIHTRLSAVNAKLFAVGIGEGHKKATLAQIAPDKGRFTGIYIDTSLKKETIEGAISKIYDQAVASFQKLTLRSSQLEAGTWSVNKVPSVKKETQTKCRLGSISEASKILRYIKIHWEKLKAPLNLSPLRFDLTFKDPKGRPGQMTLYWKPNCIIDPKIAKEAN